MGQPQQFGSNVSYGQPQQFVASNMEAPQVVLEENHEASDETAPLVSNETQIQIQDNLYHQQEQHYCGYSLHYCSAFLNFGLWAAILFFIIMAAIAHSQPRTVLIDRLWLAAYVCLPIIYLIYMGESLFSSTSKYLWNLNYAEDVTSFIYRLQHIAPVVWMECECYHYETRHRHVHKTDSNGRSYTETEHYEERVTTYRGKENFQYGRFEDLSGAVHSDLLTYNAVRIDFSKSWVAGDPMTQAAYSSQYNAFKAHNMYRDTHFNIWEGMDIPGFTEKMMTLVDVKVTSPVMSWTGYFLISLFTLSYPYRMWLERNSFKAKYHFTKRVFIQ